MTAINFDAFTDAQKSVYYQVMHTGSYYWLESIMTFDDLELTEEERERNRIIELTVMVATIGGNALPLFDVQPLVNVIYEDWKQDEELDLI